MRSENINELAAALAKAQAKITGAVKNAANPHFRSNYANLEAVWDAIREPLTSNGLAAIQTTETSGTGQLELVTTLVHSSGQYIQGRFPIMATKQDPQGLGSATSYARRFALAAIVGVYQTDDDAEAATTRGASLTSEPKKTTAPKVSVPQKPQAQNGAFAGKF